MPPTSFDFSCSPESLRNRRAIVYPDGFRGEEHRSLLSYIDECEEVASARRLASGDVVEESVLSLRLIGEVENGARYHEKVPHHLGTPSVPPLSAWRLNGYPRSLQGVYYNQSEGRMEPEEIGDETHHQALVHGVSLRDVTPGLSPSPDPSSADEKTEDDESPRAAVDDSSEESGDSGDEDGCDDVCGQGVGSNNEHDGDDDEEGEDSDDDSHDRSYVPSNARGSRNRTVPPVRYALRRESRVVGSANDAPEVGEEVRDNRIVEGQKTVNTRNRRRATRRGAESGVGTDNAQLQPSLGKRKRAAADRPEEVAAATTAGHAPGGSRSTSVVGRSESPPLRDQTVACQWQGCGEDVQANHKGLKKHLKEAHGLDLHANDKELITCLWLGCYKGEGGGPVELQRMNLTRHILSHQECKEHLVAMGLAYEPRNVYFPFKECTHGETLTAISSDHLSSGYSSAYITAILICKLEGPGRTLRSGDHPLPPRKDQADTFPCINCLKSPPAPRRESVAQIAWALQDYQYKSDNDNHREDISYN
ncbi:hypothetical protein GLOTRDRAFT_96373 [Gloeophyllum trabeum ATCC 11539]|uniref:C2H2-type domain-containing protein n=1 Tax=Gloeophyllum trabeum (strain ATCC 11539 / FP-39264 / Madison 617) TaxID=670483 RepID=S7PVK2_GLOTA|nr:uncharacterized protein GLOTRDRAFT_96373 [Gloeophyllum trabeum ATCC 11539]EPQ51661.1 hypothetical protein GLOTRDRAFT_96373 [Gloeophyllum trabeum ATCC 11539]